MAPTKAPRRQYIVYRHVQFYYLVVWILGVVAALTVAGLLFFFYYYKPTHIDGVSRLEWRDIRLPYIVLVSLLFSTVGLSMAMGMHAIFSNHKIAGAAYRIRESIRRVRQQKDYDHVIHLREGDYLQEIADGVNGMIGDFQGVRDVKEAILTDIAELKRAAADGPLDTGKATQLAGEIEKKLQRL